MLYHFMLNLYFSPSLEDLDALCYFNAQAIVFQKHMNEH